MLVQVVRVWPMATFAAPSIPAENDMAHLVADFVHTWRLQAAWRYFARGVLRCRRRYWGLHLAEVWLTNLIDERSRLP